MVSESKVDELDLIRPRWRPTSGWTGHIPFAGWVVATQRPNVLVELGSFSGASYMAFCQSVRENNLDTKCFAVDTWQGDAHAGQYDETIYKSVDVYNARTYGDFSTLMRMTFDAALAHFTEGSVDLLHIDGLHTYDAVRHDFESWLPKMSSRGVVLFHDTVERRDDFGVWRLWSEVRRHYPHFEFQHSHGLGVLFVGAGATPGFEAMLAGARNSNSKLQRFAKAGADLMARKWTPPSRDWLTRTAAQSVGWPLVTVMIPTFNQERFIAEAITSALNQDYPNLQVIVSDDGSTDATAQISKRYLVDERLQYFRNEKNLGRVGNYRDTLYKKALGEWVINLDGDDYFTDPHFISSAISVALSDPEIVLVFGRAIFKVDGQSHGLVLNENAPPESVVTGEELLYRFPPYHGLGPLHMSSIYRRDIATQIDAYRANILASDGEFLYRIGLGHKVAFIPDTSGVWRQHGNNDGHGLNEVSAMKELELTKNLAAAMEATGYLSSQAFNSWKRKMDAGLVFTTLALLIRAKNYTAIPKTISALLRSSPGSWRPFVIMFPQRAGQYLLRRSLLALRRLAFFIYRLPFVKPLYQSSPVRVARKSVKALLVHAK